MGQGARGSQAAYLAPGSEAIARSVNRMFICGTGDSFQRPFIRQSTAGNPGATSLFSVMAATAYNHKRKVSIRLANPAGCVSKRSGVGTDPQPPSGGFTFAKSHPETATLTK